MLKPKSKFLLAFVFCFLDGMFIGSAATAFDYADYKFGLIMILFSIVVIWLTISYIITVFKTTNIRSRLEKLLEDAVNYSHFD